MMTAGTITRNGCFPEPTEEGGSDPLETVCYPEPGPDDIWDMYTQSLADSCYINQDEIEEVDEESQFSKYGCNDD